MRKVLWNDEQSGGTPLCSSEFCRLLPIEARCDNKDVKEGPRNNEG